MYISLANNKIVVVVVLGK